MDTRLRGYDILSSRSKNCKDSAYLDAPLFNGDNSQPLFGANPRANTSDIHYFTGFDLAQDRFLVPIADLLGEEGVMRPAQPSPALRFVPIIIYTNSGGMALVLASRDNTFNWNNPAGGPWAAAANWLPAAVPSAGDRAIFDLDASYNVDLDAEHAEFVNIRGGDVTLRNGQLTIGQTGLTVAGNSPGETPRLTIVDDDADSDVTLVTTDKVAVGFAQPGELLLSQASLSLPENGGGLSLIGFAATGSVTVTNSASWRWAELAVGMSSRASLRVEDGALVGFLGDRLWIGGSPLGLALSNERATAVVANTSSNPGLFNIGAQLGPVDQIIIGEALIGEMSVLDGGTAKAITTTLGTRNHGTTTDAFLTVSGGNELQTAQFVSGAEAHGGLFAATGAGSDVLITVSGGGVMTLTQLSLADGANSRALMFVDALEDVANEPGRSLVTVTAVHPNGSCVVGRVGRGTLNVSNGALVQCRQIVIGLGNGSRGEVNIDGELAGFAAQLIAAGPGSEDGLICIGRASSCGAVAGSTVNGLVTLGDTGRLKGTAVLLGPGGRIQGSGVVKASEGVANTGGTIAPGVTVLASRSVAGLESRIGALTIQGGLTVSETGEIALDIWGSTAVLQDRLMVTGAMVMDGRLALNFDNAYAPQTGDEFVLITAVAFSGAPSEVVITGLEDGFEYDLDFSSGALTLTALNDGLPTTEPIERVVYLPMIVKAAPSR